MAKKEEKKKPSSKVKGKMAALKGLHRMASDMMGADVKGLKKVSVMAKDKKGLKKGLEKAEALVGDDDSSEC
jgi:hypothetical protein